MGSTQGAHRATADRVATALTAPLAEVGLDLEAVELTPAGNRRVLRVAVDRDGGVSLDDVASATKVIDRILETPGPDGGADAMGQQPYTLEVTSRGVDRPLTLARHWRRNEDRLVRVTVRDGDRTVEHLGRIVIGASGEEATAIEVDGAQVPIVYADVVKALVQVEFNRRRPAAAEADEQDDVDDIDEDDDLDENDENDDTDENEDD